MCECWESLWQRNERGRGLNILVPNRSWCAPHGSVLAVFERGVVQRGEIFRTPPHHFGPTVRIAYQPKRNRTNRGEADMGTPVSYDSHSSLIAYYRLGRLGKHSRCDSGSDLAWGQAHDESKLSAMNRGCTLIAIQNQVQDREVR